MSNPKKPKLGPAESQLEKTQEANKRFKDSLSILKQQDETYDLSRWDEPIIDDFDNDLESESVKRKFLLYKTLPTPKIKTEDDKDEDQIPSETIYVITLEKDGKVIAYSIGHAGFSDQFHDISHMNMSFSDFKKQLDASVRQGDSAANIVNAFKEKLPGQRTYIDKSLQASATEFLSKSLKDKAEETVADKSRITPFSTTPKPL